MPGFRHTNLSCGPTGQLILHRTECLLCHWRATGHTSALKAAEYAHRCRELPDNTGSKAMLFARSGNNEVNPEK